jgi:hypothetical protein
VHALAYLSPVWLASSTSIKVTSQPPPPLTLRLPTVVCEREEPYAGLFPLHPHPHRLAEVGSPVNATCLAQLLHELLLTRESRSVFAGAAALSIHTYCSARR